MSRHLRSHPHQIATSNPDRTSRPPSSSMMRGHRVIARILSPFLRWLDRRIDARIDAARTAEADRGRALVRRRAGQMDEIRASGGRPAVSLESGQVIDLGSQSNSAAYAAAKAPSRNPSATDEDSLAMSRSSIVTASENML